MTTMYTVTFKAEDGRTVGWLSRNLLIARKRENALELDESSVRYSSRYYCSKAKYLLDGPHPLDHHGPLRVEVCEVDKSMSWEKA